MFLHPLLLLGLAATAIPVVVHLLNRRRYVDVTWAAMRFLRVADDRSRRRRQVDDWLLMLLRAGILALLAVAAAGPVLGRLVPVAGSVTAVLVIDCSASMTGTDGVASRFDRAKAVAARRLADLPAGSAVAVLMASDTVQPLVPSPTRDLSLAAKLIAAAPVTDRGSDLLPAVRAAADVLHVATGAKELDVITDGQRAAFARRDDIAAVLRSATDVSARIAVVGPDVTADVSVTDVRPAGDLTPAGRPLRFEATVANGGTEPVHDLPVRLSIDDAAPAAEATVADLPAGESRVVALYAKLPTPGQHAVTASVPPDRLPADDRRTIIVRAPDRVRVLLVDADQGDRSAAAFLHAALLPIPADRRPDYFVQVDVVPPSAVGTTKLDDYAAVVVAGTPDAAAYGAYVRNGGGLIVFPGPGGVADATHLLPAAIGPLHGDASHPLPVSAGPFDHPIAAVWNDPANGTPAAVHVFHAHALTPDAVTTADAGPPRVVLRFADGQPLVVERAFGRGRSVLFAIAADTAASDLPDRGGLFVPLVYRCLAAAVARGGESLTVAVGQPLVGTAAVTDVGHPATVRTPTGTADTTVTLTGDAASFRYDATDRAGEYAVTVGTATTLFAAQGNPTESNLATLTADDRTALSAVATVADGFDAATAPARGGGQASLPLLLAALALAVAEPFVANAAGRRR